MGKENKLTIKEAVASQGFQNHCFKGKFHERNLNIGRQQTLKKEQLSNEAELNEPYFKNILKYGEDGHFMFLAAPEKLNQFYHISNTKLGYILFQNR